MNAPSHMEEIANRQLDRYAEDFGALFAEYQDIRTQFDLAIRDSQRASEVQQSLGLLLNSIEDVGLVVTDCNGIIDDVNPAAAALLDFDIKATSGTSLAQLVAESDRDMIGDLILALGYTTGSAGTAPVDIHLVLSSGAPLSGRVVRVPHPSQSYRLHWLLRKPVVATAWAERRAELFSQLYARSHNGILITDTAGTILSINPAFTEITGYSEDEVVGQTPRMFSSGRHDRQFYQYMWDSLLTEGEWQGDIWNRRRNGDIFLEWMHILAVRDDEGTPTQFVAMIHDASQYRNTDNRIYELANLDPLTGLPNRSLGKNKLQQAIADARRNNGTATLFFVDLDRFKQVNDTLGHLVGDQLLIDFSWRLVSAIRDTDVASRLGGDEFMVIAPNLAHEEDIHDMASRIIRSLAEAFEIEGRELYVGASIGVAVYPVHGDDTEALLRHADTAMYAAKKDGGNTCRLFDQALVLDRSRRLEFEAGLRRALIQGQLKLAYQPQVSAGDHRVVGVECLLRWEQPGRGIVPPDQFIPIAEETGLIVPIGDWVLRTACLQLNAWRRQGLPPVRAAINVTARQLNDSSFAKRVDAILAETGVDPACLELEITESQLMERLHVGLDNLQHIRSRGIAVAVDDFGTGYSSLGRIRSLPIDRIKVDKVFVADIATNRDSHAVTHAILAMASALDLEVTAEGVEIQEQARILEDLDCRELQGYLFGGPQPPESIALMLERQNGGDS